MSKPTGPVAWCASRLPVWAVLTGALLVPALASGNSPGGRNATGALRQSSLVAPAYFVENTAVSGKGKQLVADPDVLAFLQTRRGRVLFSANGAYLGISSSSASGEDAGRNKLRLEENGQPVSGGQTTVLKTGFGQARGKTSGPAGFTLEDPTGAVFNSFRGAPGEWRTGLPMYASLVYRDVWQGIDLSFQGFQDRLDYRLRLAPGARPADIVMETGASRLKLEADGSLRAESGNAALLLSAPRAYQEIDGKSVEVAAGYRILENGCYTFELGPYQQGQALLINPKVRWISLLGPDGLEVSGSDAANCLALDSNGNVYVAGKTQSPDFPVVAGCYDTTQAEDSTDAFVAKLNPNGSGLIYSTLLGGTSSDLIYGIVLDGGGNAYVTGRTSSEDFPSTTLIGPRGESDVFVAKLNTGGTALVYSTVLGGAGYDRGNGIGIDNDYSVYVAGETQSADFPVNGTSYDTTANGTDAFLFKLSSNGTGLFYSTFLGGAESDYANDVAVSGSGYAYVTGNTKSAAFPTTGSAFMKTPQGEYDVFVTKFNTTGTALLYSTYLGGSADDAAYAITVNGDGYAVVAGSTKSTNFPCSGGAWDHVVTGEADAFVTKLNPAGSALAASTLLGGNNLDGATDVALDAAGNIYLAGKTESTAGLVPAGSYMDAPRGGDDAFTAKFNSACTSLLLATYLGGRGDDSASGLALDSNNNIYLCGSTNSADFPKSQGAFDISWNAGSEDAFVSKIRGNMKDLLYSTFLGGSARGEWAGGVAADAAGSAYVLGETQSAQFPVTAGVYDGTVNGDRDIFVTKFNTAGTALVYSTVVGSRKEDSAGAIAVDAAGNAYVTGDTYAGDFPTTAGTLDRSQNGNNDVFVFKLNPGGTSLLYSTYLGGSESEYGMAIAADTAGNAYVTGYTYSDSFPVTAGALDTTLQNGPDVYVSKLNAAGNALSYSTFLGGSVTDEGYEIAVDSTGNVFVCGYTTSADFPVTAGAYDQSRGGSLDSFLAKLNPAGTALVFSTYLGGSGSDFPHGLAVDSAGQAFVSGGTSSSDFPVTAGAWSAKGGGTSDAFVTKFNAAGSALVYSTCLGSTTASCEGLVLDKPGNAYIIGSTSDTGFPVTGDADSGSLAGNNDVFLTKLNAAGTDLLYSTFLGGSGYDWAQGVALTSSGHVYVTGHTSSTDFPATAGAYDTVNNAGPDVFLAKFWLDSRNYTIGGNTGIGAQAPARAMHMSGVNAVFRMDRSVDASAFLMVRTTEPGEIWKSYMVGTEASGVNDGQFVFRDKGIHVDDTGGYGRLIIRNDGTAQMLGDVKAKGFVETSSARFKMNIEPLAVPAEQLGLLRGVRYHWKADGTGGGGKADLGFIAEEVRPVVPEAVQADPVTESCGVNYTKLLAVALECMKEQQSRLNNITNQRDAIREKLEQLVAGKR